MKSDDLKIEFCILADSAAQAYHTEYRTGSLNKSIL